MYLVQSDGVGSAFDGSATTLATPVADAAGEASALVASTPSATMPLISSAGLFDICVKHDDALVRVYVMPPQGTDSGTSTVLVYQTTDGSVHFEVIFTPARCAARGFPDFAAVCAQIEAYFATVQTG